MDDPLPKLWLRGGGRPARAVINWDATPYDFAIPLERYPQLRQAAA